MTTIDRFEGQYRFLSNFYEGNPIRASLEEVWPGNWGAPKTFDTAEHYFQAAKTLDPREQEIVRSADSPGEAKKRGRHRVELRRDWDEMRISIMSTTVGLKFLDPDLEHLLLLTGDARLVEGNWWGDRFWGVSRGQGLNWLGELLMSERDLIRNGGPMRHGLPRVIEPVILAA